MNTLFQTIQHGLRSFGDAFSSLTVMIALLLMLSVGAMAAIKYPHLLPQCPSVFGEGLGTLPPYR